MLAFAGNSVLTRLALAETAIDPGAFVLLRLASGAAVLVFLTARKNSLSALRGPKRLSAALALSFYMLGFSYAYTKLETGAGALILFGVVQIVMFGVAVFTREPLPRYRVIGASIAFGGLCYLLVPTASLAMDPFAVGLMVLAGLGWGGYSIFGRNAGPSLPATAASFALSLPLCAVVVWFSTSAPPVITPYGVMLALLSGAVTSAMGYALWYWILPQISTSIASVSQLVVPVLAMAAGMVFLEEVLTIKFIVACGLVVSGVAISLGLHRSLHLK